LLCLAGDIAGNGLALAPPPDQSHRAPAAGPSPVDRSCQRTGAFTGITTGAPGCAGHDSLCGEAPGVGTVAAFRGLPHPLRRWPSFRHGPPPRFFIVVMVRGATQRRLGAINFCLPPWPCGTEAALACRGLDLPGQDQAPSIGESGAAPFGSDDRWRALRFAPSDQTFARNGPPSRWSNGGQRRGATGSAKTASAAAPFYPPAGLLETGPAP